MAKKKAAGRTGQAYRIAVIPGDGTGPEVVREGLKVLETVAEAVGIAYETTDFDFTGARYLARGGDPTKPSIPVITEEDIAKLRTFDAIYLGAV
ncbi:MAG: isocitrate/isopropylmalate family dehydrogenase, partial [Planctomycetota bacterium]|nr:isocitrate/isopropylmalate family dehydrogenase [Planctomycetota bacterium]